MSRSITCALCQREVDNADTVELPLGLVCLDPCYLWMERMIEESQEEEELDIEFYETTEDE